MKPQQDNSLTDVFAPLPKARMPRDLIALIEAETLLKPHWWETDAFKRRWIPTMLGMAAAMGAWLIFHLCTPAPISMAKRPMTHPAIALHHVDESSRTDVLQ